MHANTPAGRFALQPQTHSSASDMCTASVQRLLFYFLFFCFFFLTDQRLKCIYVALIFFNSMSYLFFNHSLTAWFMNSRTWPGLHSKWEQMRVFRGKMSCRRVIVTAQPSRVVALPWQLSVAASSHENFERGRVRFCSTVQYLMKNLSEVAIRVCHIR